MNLYTWLQRIKLRKIGTWRWINRVWINLPIVKCKFYKWSDCLRFLPSNARSIYRFRVALAMTTSNAWSIYRFRVALAMTTSNARSIYTFRVALAMTTSNEWSIYRFWVALAVTNVILDREFFAPKQSFLDFALMHHPDSNLKHSWNYFTNLVHIYKITPITHENKVFSNIYHGNRTPL